MGMPDIKSFFTVVSENLEPDSGKKQKEEVSSDIKQQMDNLFSYNSFSGLGCLTIMLIIFIINIILYFFFC